jgi:GAF domain-containing protein
MQKPEIPINESDRLVALDRYKILDTLPEQVYDDLTQLAADICGTPIALISLIDKDRQWFKSRVGIDATETPRDISFCGHAVAANAILNVPDASLDPRFADNPLVAKEPNIRLYVGVPLITDDNFALGTLCVIDRQPHDLTEQQIRQLEALSRLVISQFELRLKEEALRLLASVVESSDDAIITETLEGIITSTRWLK